VLFIGEENGQEIEALAEAIEGLEDEQLVGSVDVDYVGHPQRAADLFGAVGLDSGGGAGGGGSAGAGGAGAKGLTAANALEAAAACEALLQEPANKLIIEGQLQMAGPSPDKMMLVRTTLHILTLLLLLSLLLMLVL